MKKLVPLFVLCIPGILALVIYSCKKDTVTPTPVGLTSLSEEFEDISRLNLKGWVTTDNSFNGNGNLAPWDQGRFGSDKSGVWYGFAAYSFSATPDEFAYSYLGSMDSTRSLSSWFITPVLSVKNGDHFSFYTRGDTTAIYTDRMQVFMNNSASANVGNTLSSLGDFTKKLFDINENQAAGGYPTDWTKYEYTFSGISEKTNLRIGFRHFVTNPVNARGVGIDLFRFESN